ncbi:MAG: ribosome biogenesis GTP-binding protein YihA/YsxC [Bryobacteraceae bacterium]
MSAATPDRFPKEGYPEVAFLGRSNVGKSSLINALVGQKKLAFTSSKPGCTQTLNFYRIDGAMYFVDLPGYGYAKVSKTQTLEWQKLIENYLRERESLSLAILVLDARRGWMETDLDLKRWLEQRQRQFLAIATKVDKLKNQKELQQSLKSLREGGVEPLLFSAETGRGVREIWQAIMKTRRP